jgi:hypothetical protein
MPLPQFHAHIEGSGLADKHIHAFAIGAAESSPFNAQFVCARSNQEKPVAAREVRGDLALQPGGRVLKADYGAREGRAGWIRNHPEQFAVSHVSLRPRGNSARNQQYAE